MKSAEGGKNTFLLLVLLYTNLAPVHCALFSSIIHYHFFTTGKKFNRFFRITFLPNLFVKHKDAQAIYTICTTQSQIIYLN